MKVTMAQVAVGSSLRENKNGILEILAHASRDEWVVFPEGVLSGYFPADEDYVQALDQRSIEEAVAEIDHVVRQVGCHALLGSAVRGATGWTNTIISMHPHGPGTRYDKIELSALDRRHFVPGASVSVHRSGGVAFGVLACREVLFPGHWAALKAQGAQIVFHLNNAIQPKDARWAALFVARALENSLFVCSVNNCASPQALPSYLVAPDGSVLAETRLLHPHLITTEIDLSSVITDLSTRADY